LLFVLNTETQNGLFWFSNSTQTCGWWLPFTDWFVKNAVRLIYLWTKRSQHLLEMRTYNPLNPV